MPKNAPRYCWLHIKAIKRILYSFLNDLSITVFPLSIALLSNSRYLSNSTATFLYLSQNVFIGLLLFIGILSVVAHYYNRSGLWRAALTLFCFSFLLMGTAFLVSGRPLGAVLSYSVCFHSIANELHFLPRHRMIGPKRSREKYDL